MRAGISPDGRHYYPAFPCASSARASAQDILDLHSYSMTLPVSDEPNLPHEAVFPFGVRRGIGLWKTLHLSNVWVVTGDLSPVAERGRYLAEALGHCGECHTPRGPLGGSDRSRWLAGAPDPSGRGRIPSIAPGDLDWSEAEIAAYLEDGFTPDFDTAGGSMAAVIENTARLTDECRAAIAAYLKSVPAVELTDSAATGPVTCKRGKDRLSGISSAENRPSPNLIQDERLPSPALPDKQRAHGASARSSEVPKGTPERALAVADCLNFKNDTRKPWPPGHLRRKPRLPICIRGHEPATLGPATMASPE